VTPEQLLDLARAGDLETLGARRQEVSDAVDAFVEAGEPAAALELVGRAWRVWFSRGELAEGSAVAANALAAPGAQTVPTWYVRALYADGVIAFRSGDLLRSRARNEEALRVARATNDVRGECDALTGLARVALRDGRYGDVVALAREARERARTVSDQEAEAAPLHLEAAGVRLQHDYAAARDLYLESLELNAASGNEAWVAMEQHNLGWVELHLGNVDAAEAWFQERDAGAGDDAYGDAWSSLNRAAVALARGDTEPAAQLLEAGKRALEDLGVALDPDDQSELDWLDERVAARRD
jgi:tetratricopeptide (TPR) repeat protein